ncbi:MAG: outer membrane protein assembly factor BamA [Nitrospiraceae bacterium]|nr:MAG: outer membrane protein assembly factor BamA [Nitrospiraceae bacterium]
MTDYRHIDRLIIFCILTLLCLVSFPAFAQDSPEIIKAIEVEGLTRMPEKELTDIICFKKGAVLDREALRNGIRRAFEKGLFYDIKAVSAPYEDGIMLKYIVDEIPLVKNILVEGNSNISGKKIKKVLPYKEGEDFREEYLEKAKTDLLDFCVREGFPAASVTVSAEKTEITSEVSLRVHIDEGSPLIIETIETPDDARELLRISEGDILNRDILDRDMKRLEDYFRKQDYIRPEVGPYELIDGRLIIPVRKGRRVELYFKGNNSVGEKKLREEVPFYEDQGVTDETVQEALDRMRNVYLSRGYFHVQIAAGIETEDDVVKVTFIFFEGKRVILRNITFEGNSISSEVLKSIVPLQEDKPYDDTLLESAGESIVRFYNALGYLKADVTGTEKELRADGSEADLTIKISEGGQTRIRKIGISGNARIGASEIKDALQLQEEAPYNIVDIGDARYRVLSLYGRHGYIDARVEVESIIEDDNAFLTFSITEGKPSVTGKIIYRGNRKTKTKIIDREFTVKEGDTFNYEELLNIKQRLYKLGIFNEVSIESLEPEASGEDELKRDLLVSLKEGKAGSVEVSLGYGDYEKFRGALDITYRNIGGYNRQAGFRAEASSVEKRLVLSFREPRFLNKPDVPLNMLLIREDTRSVNIDTNETLFEIDRVSFVAGLEKEIRKKWKAALNYEYSFVDTHDVAPGVVLSPEDTGTIAIGSVSPSIFYDTRDDPFDPATGSLHGIVLKIASRALLSETDFIKGTFQSSWFFPVTRKVVFAFSLRGGAAFSYDNIKELPLVERFFLGGRTTVRGYSNDTLGPKGINNTPTGGNIFALMNGEFRVALGKGFGLVTFLDAGNVWQLFEDIKDELKYTAGIGLRYRTPVGPFRVDYGRKMNREPGESSGEIHYSFGHAF